MHKQLRLFDDAYSRSQPQAKGLKARLYRFFFGDDIFISYSRSDAGKYAMALALSLSEHGYLCFLDQLGTDVNRNMPESLKEKVRNSTALVLVGTEGAVASRYVREEVEIFKESKRVIIPINVDGALHDDEWPELSGLSRVTESQSRVSRGEVSNDTITQLKNSAHYRRRNQVLRLSLIAGFVFIAATVLISSGASFLLISRAEAQTAEAQFAAATATNLEKLASNAADAAKTNEQRAQAKADSATVRMTEANDKATVAQLQQESAEKGMRNAQSLEREAKIRADEAARLEQGSRAITYAREPGREFEALNLALGAAESEVNSRLPMSQPVVDGLTASVTSIDQAVQLQGIQDEIELTRISRNASRVFVSTNRKPLDGSNEETERWGIWDARTGLPVSGTIVKKKEGGARGALNASFSADASRLVILGEGLIEGPRGPNPLNTFWLFLCDEATRPCSPHTPMIAQRLPEPIYSAELDREGKQIAFVTSSRGIENLWVADLDWSAPNPLPPATQWRRVNGQLEARQLDSFRFGLDNGLIAFVAGYNSSDSLIYDVEKCAVATDAPDCRLLRAPSETSFEGLTDGGDFILSKNPPRNSFQRFGSVMLIPRFAANGDRVGERTLGGFKGTLRALTVAEGRPFAVTQQGEQIYVSGAATLNSFATLRGHEHALTAVRYSPDGLHAMTLDQDGFLNLWDAATTNLLDAVELPKAEQSSDGVLFSGVAAFSEDGTQIVAVNRSGGFGIWKVESATGKLKNQKMCIAPKEVWDAASLVFGIALVKDKIVTRHPLGKFYEWDYDCKLKRSFATDSTQNPSASSPSGDSLFSIDGTRTVSVSGNKQVQLWNLSDAGIPDASGTLTLTPQTIGQLPEGRYSVRSVAYNSDATLLVANENDPSFYVWRESTGQMKRLPGSVPTKFVYQVRTAISRDGSRAAAIGDRGDVVIWDLNARKILLTFNWGAGGVSATIPIGFSLDHEEIIIASPDGTARIYPVTEAGFLAAGRQMLHNRRN